METVVGRTNEVPEGGVVAFKAGERTVAVANVDGALYAFDDVCTHRGCSLSEGPLDGNVITCPCHRSKFDVRDGSVVAGPATAPVESFAVSSEGGEIRVSMRDDSVSAATQAPATTQAAPAATPAEKVRTYSALASVPLFSGLDEAAVASLEPFTFKKTFGPGEVIVEEGRTGNGLYIVLSGEVEVVKGLGTARPQVAARLGPGEPFGEMSLLGDWKRSASVRALNEVECLGMDRWAFLAHLNKEPRLAVKMLQMLATRLAETSQRLGE